MAKKLIRGRRVVLAALALGMAANVTAQSRSLTFTSVSEARYFFYLNGKLQNQQAVATITLDSLDDKDYHIRIVVDDPYEVAVVKTLRPSLTPSRYTLLFNPVKERILVATERRDEQSATDNDGAQRQPKTGVRTSRTSLSASRRQARTQREEPPASRGSDIHTVKQPVFDE